MCWKPPQCISCWPGICEGLKETLYMCIGEFWSNILGSTIHWAICFYYQLVEVECQCYIPHFVLFAPFTVLTFFTLLLVHNFKAGISQVRFSAWETSFILLKKPIKIVPNKNKDCHCVVIALQSTVWIK